MCMGIERNVATCYMSVARGRVRQKAERLPVQGVPPEIIRLMGHDTDLDKVQVQKAATPVAGRTTLERAATKLERRAPMPSSWRGKATMATSMLNASRHFDDYASN